jgi:signal transduction histidine kinase
MIERFEWFLIGFSGLFEIVLLLLLCQPINRSHVAPWLKWLVGGAFLYHLGYFLRLLFHRERMETAAWLDQIAMLLLCSGMLLMPSAMLHAAIRLRGLTSGSLKPLPPKDWRYGLLYLPLLCLVPAIGLIWSGPEGDFMASIAPLSALYVGWLFLSNLVSAVLFSIVAYRTDLPMRRFFFGWMAVLLSLFTAGAFYYALVAVDTEYELVARLAAGVAPLGPSILFVWYSLKSRLLPVVFEQSIIYGGIVLFLLFLHRLIVTPFTIQLRESADIDFIVLEVLAVAALVWWIRPLRKRASESLRFLMSPSAFRFRDEIRNLALAITQKTSDDAMGRCQWFANELQKRFEISWVRVCLGDSDGKLKLDFTSPEVNAKSAVTENCLAVVHSLLLLVPKCTKAIERGEEPTPELSEHMESLECDLAIPMVCKSVRGVVLFGSRQRFGRLADEQVTSLLVLVEQFAATLQNQREDELRRRAEHHSLQQEKLSTLGMISGSLAHELRNPLSSIRTIASLVLEDLPLENTNRQDLRLIVTEVDRLTSTLQRVLDFSRPPERMNPLSEPDRVISRLLAIMDFFAKQNQTELEITLNATGVQVASSDIALNEIFMNLVKNAIEASSDREHAKVSVTSNIEDDCFVATIEDNGIGISPERIQAIFQPFETSKSTGTGLGLYIVAERVQQIGGTIKCTSIPSQGSRFVVRIPIVIATPGRKQRLQ